MKEIAGKLELEWWSVKDVLWEELSDELYGELYIELRNKLYWPSDLEIRAVTALHSILTNKYYNIRNDITRDRYKMETNNINT